MLHLTLFMHPPSAHSVWTSPPVQHISKHQLFFPSFLKKIKNKNNIARLSELAAASSAVARLTHTLHNGIKAMTLGKLSAEVKMSQTPRTFVGCGAALCRHTGAGKTWHQIWEMIFLDFFFLLIWILHLFHIILNLSNQQNRMIFAYKSS